MNLWPKICIISIQHMYSSSKNEVTTTFIRINWIEFQLVLADHLPIRGCSKRWLNFRRHFHIGPILKICLKLLQGVFRLCEFHYCAFSTHSRNIWLMRFWAKIFHYFDFYDIAKYRKIRSNEIFWQKKKSISQIFG